MDGHTNHDLSGALALRVRGTPRPKQSVRWVAGRPVAVTDANRLARAWAAAVRNAALGARLERGAGLVGPVLVSVEFMFPTSRADRWGLVHLVRPDADNLAKLLGDELARSGLIADDSAIAWGRIVKLWSAPVDAGASVLIQPGAVASARANKTPPAWLAGGAR